MMQDYNMTQCTEGLMKGEGGRREEGEGGREERGGRGGEGGEEGGGGGGEGGERRGMGEGGGEREGREKWPFSPTASTHTITE